MLAGLPSLRGRVGARLGVPSDGLLASRGSIIKWRTWVLRLHRIHRLLVPVTDP